MATTQTTNLALDKPGVGDLSWGTILNGTIDRVDALFSLNGTSNPTGSVTPSYINQYYVDTSANKAYVSRGLTSADWFLLNAVVSPHHNICINGAFEIWQRGSSTAAASLGVYNYLADRIFVNPAGAGITQERALITSLSGAKTKYCLQLDGVSASTTTVAVGQRIESANVRQLRGDGVTISCWVYNGSGTSFTPTFEVHTPSAENNFGSLTLVATLSPGISCGNAAWTRVYASVNAAGVNAWADIDHGLQVSLVIPTAHMLAGHSNKIAEFQIQEGTTLTTFLPRLFSEILQLCQRYYWKTYDQNVVPGTSTDVGALRWYAAATGGGWFYQIVYPVEMVKVPTVTFYSPITGAAGYARNYSGTDNPVGTTWYGDGGVGLVSCSVIDQGSSVGGQLRVHATFNAEL